MILRLLYFYFINQINKIVVVILRYLGYYLYRSKTVCISQLTYLISEQYMSNMVNRSEIENEENGKKLILKIYKKNSIYYIKVLAYLVNLQKIYI